MRSIRFLPTFTLVTLGAVLAFTIYPAASAGVGSTGSQNEKIEILKALIGTWNCDGSFPATGKRISSTMSFETGLGGSAIVKRHDDRSPSIYHAIEVWEFDATKRRYTAAVIDNFGGMRLFSSDGWQSGVLTWSTAIEAKPIQQFQYALNRDGSMRVDYRVSRDGSTFTLGDTLQCTRG